MKTMSIRNIPTDVSDALNLEKRRRGVSLNQTVIELLRGALGVGGARRSNGLARLSGSWTEDEAREVEEAIAFLGEPEPEVWE